MRRWQFAIIASTVAFSAPAGAEADGRPGYYACNSYNVTTKVSYYSPIVVRPYDDRSWTRRLEADFAKYTAQNFPGEYHGGGASCWVRLNEADAKQEIASSKRAHTMYDNRKTWRDAAEWVAAN